MNLDFSPLSLPLRADEIAYRYPNSEYGLPPFTLDVKAGEFVHIEGPSGSGKSTLARCLAGLIPHLYHGELQGSVWLDHLKTADHPLWQLAEQAGMVFQNPAAQMLSTSAEEEIVFGLENLGLSPGEIGARLDAVIEDFSLEGLRDRSPQTLSGGEQQKLALAAIMARQPAALILDEPLSMLDTVAAQDLVRRLTALADNGTSIVFFEHRAEYLDAVPGLRRLSLNGRDHRPDQLTTELCFRPTPSPIELVVDSLAVQMGGRMVLQDFNLAARGGETIVIVGRNGSGKTTLLRALAGLQKHEGTIMVSGERPELGMVFQNADLQLFNATVREEILFRVRAPDLALYRALLDALGLAGYEETPPLLLSEGEKKRVALAAVLAHQPRHGILLDEPSLGQDSAHKEMLIRIARALNRAGLLVIMTTHDLTLAARADRIILLGPGGIMADGPSADVMCNQAAWARAGLCVPGWITAPHGAQL